MARRDPLANAPDLIRRIYSYVAYRLGDGPDAEDVTSEVFERALRYRKSYDRYWEAQRKQIVERGTGRLAPNEAGPITLGYRLGTERTQNAPSVASHSWRRTTA